MSQTETLNHILYRTRKSALASMLKEFGGAPMVPEVAKAIEEEKKVVVELERKMKMKMKMKGA